MESGGDRTRAFALTEDIAVRSRIRGKNAVFTTFYTRGCSYPTHRISRLNTPPQAV